MRPSLPLLLLAAFLSGGVLAQSVPSSESTTRFEHQRRATAWPVLPSSGSLDHDLDSHPTVSFLQQTTAMSVPPANTTALVEVVVHAQGGLQQPPRVGGHQMRSLAAATTVSLTVGQYVTAGPSTTGTMSLGYWFQTIGSVANVDAMLIYESDYATFQAGGSVSYLVAYSSINTASAKLSTKSFSGVTAPLRFVLVGRAYAATTVQGMVNFINGVCATSCFNGGICNAAGGCDCAPNGWGGSSCSTPICSTVTCNAHQTCTAPNICSCQAGWSGADCSLATCNPACVAGQGVCTTPGVCTCSAGFSGVTCSMVGSASTGEYSCGSPEAIALVGDKGDCTPSCSWDKNCAGSVKSLSHGATWSCYCSSPSTNLLIIICCSVGGLLLVFVVIGVVSCLRSRKRAQAFRMNCMQSPVPSPQQQTQMTTQFSNQQQHMQQQQYGYATQQYGVQPQQQP